MGFRFRRSIKIAPGLRLNIGKTLRPSVSVGVRGAHVTVGPKGVTTSVGIPGTGLSYTDQRSLAHVDHPKEITASVPPSAVLPEASDDAVSDIDAGNMPSPSSIGGAFVVVALVVIAILGLVFLVRLVG